MKDILAEAYLRIRGITCELPPHLRFHDRFPHPLGITLPALVALVKNGCSFTFAIHGTFLQVNGYEKDQRLAKAMLDSVTSGA
ncbi:DUF7146 domain-containing protein [Bartonella henselae]|uniref:DUF7146 domain-containing protein n=1 Tax=Bartonella henselae TaxID=38323 RepID=UPI003CC9A210